MQSLPPQLVDVGCAVHMCSLLHGRYSEFSGLLLEQLQRIYSPPLPSKMDDEDRATNVTKFRLGLRLLGEVYTVYIDWYRKNQDWASIGRA